MDSITLPHDTASQWLTRMHSEYAPAAEQRGAHLTDVWWKYAEEPNAITVVLVWKLSDAGAFWMMRGAAGADPSVAAWWASTDEIAVHRERRVLSDASEGIPV